MKELLPWLTGIAIILIMVALGIGAFVLLFASPGSGEGNGVQAGSQYTNRVHDLAIDESQSGVNVKINRLIMVKEGDTSQSDHPRDTVGFEIKLQNTRNSGEGAVLFDPAMIKLETSTGEKVNANAAESTIDFDKALEEGASTSGMIIFTLEKGKVLDINWVKLTMEPRDDTENGDSNMSSLDIVIDIPKS